MASHPKTRLQHLWISPKRDPLRTGWTVRHNKAVFYPTGPEKGIMQILSGWEDYADRHRKRYESLIGDDGFLGPQWEAIGDALRSLLNGELGRLDGGTMDGAILKIMEDNGIEISEK